MTARVDMPTDLERGRYSDTAERVGVFGGSFDPVHSGHIILAESSMEELRLDRIIFVPAGLSPFKKHRPPSATPRQRLAMIKRAIRGEKRFSVDDRELRREGPSYAIDTVRLLRTDHPGARFFYLIGADNLSELGKWHDIDKLRHLVDFAVLDRGEPWKKGSSPYPVVHRRIDISSTEIRERLARGLSIRFMVPSGVYDIIMKHHLYRS